MAKLSVKDKLFNTIDDIELISRDLFESLLTPKPLKQLSHNVDISQFADLLIQKDKELKAHVKDAEEQEEFEQKMDQLKQEVNKLDDEIKQVQKNLKEAERILATAIYQSKQKLQFIRKSNENPIPSEELIKYAHKISSSHAVAAPYNWEQGDPRRPYPIDVEMRLGLICQQQSGGFPSLNPNQQEHQSSFSSELERAGSSQFLSSWNASGSQTPDIKPMNLGMSSGINVVNNLGSSSLMDMKSNGKDNLEEIEVMSTDSSSSSSSDSQ